MPTGYTTDIENDIEFEDFVLGCARAFGACIHQRDDNMKIKPALREVETYYFEHAKSAAAELAKLEVMKPQDRVEYAKNQIARELEVEQEYFNKKVLLKNKYDAMLERVQAWSPPTSDHDQLKKFMIQQIEESIKFDCNTSYALERITNLSQQNPSSYFATALESARRDVKFYSEQYEKHMVAVRESNAWITELYKSLGVEY